MSRRGKVRRAVFLSAAVAVLAGLWAHSAGMLADSTRMLDYQRRQSLNDLTDYVSGLGDTLEKAPFVSTAGMQNTVSAKLTEQSSGAKAALASLPLSQEAADRLSRFFSQVGDYALYLARRSATGQAPDEDSGQVLASLREYAGKLESALEQAQAKVGVDGLSLDGIRDELNNIEAMAGLEDDFDAAAKEFAEFPALLYDGPFSDHIPQREALELRGEREIDREEARRLAAEFLQVDVDEVADTGSGGQDRLAVWTFVTVDSQVNIARAGGKLVYYKKAGEIGAENLGPEEALEKARETLDRLGIKNYRETYWVKNDRMCTMNFASVDEAEGQEVICYPDLVKVVIELEQGGTVEVDAVGWRMNHHDRELAAPSLSREEARQQVSPKLTVTDSRLAVIPTPGLDEVLCWEFSCTGQVQGEQREFLVYINGETGMEEQLYLLVRDEHGTLVS